MESGTAPIFYARSFPRLVRILSTPLESDYNTSRKRASALKERQPQPSTEMAEPKKRETPRRFGASPEFLSRSMGREFRMT